MDGYIKASPARAYLFMIGRCIIHPLLCLLNSGCKTWEATSKRAVIKNDEAMKNYVYITFISRDFSW